MALFLPSTPRSERTTGMISADSVPALVVLLAVALVVSVVLAVAIGSVRIPAGTVWRVILAEATGLVGAEDVPRNVGQIVWELRLPRTLLAGLVGAGLAAVGVAVQALVRNPLADPYVLGVSSGASVGAALVILFGLFGGLGGLGMSLSAFVTAMVAMAVVYVVAQEKGRLDPLRLVLAGVVVGYVAAAITSFLVFSADPRAAQQVMFWLLGSFGRARWSLLGVPTVVLAVGLVHLFWRARSLDALVAGDDMATTLGVRVPALRLELFVTTAALTAVMVSVSGAVGFVGLVMPHLVRLLVGGRHRRVLPVAALAGAVFMIWVDVAARTLVAPQELPVGILTALIGGPAFIVLLRGQQRRTAR